MKPSIRQAVLGAVVILAVVLYDAGMTRADEPPPLTTASGLHTLLNPTPADQLRQMATDRPNVTNTPQTIDAGHFQLEEGFLDYARARSDKLSPYKSFIFGHSNLRVGVLDNLEVNVALDSYDVAWNADDGSGRSRKQSGVGDMVIGGKLNFWGNDGNDEPWSTALAIQPQMKLPTARSAIGNRHTEYAIGLPFSISLPADFHLGLQTALLDQRNQANTGYTIGWQNSASLDRVFFERFDVYLEYATKVAAERHRGSQQTLDLGMIYALTPNIALDSGVNFGLNATSPKTEWLAGASYRF
jgi:hypothetical protein